MREEGHRVCDKLLHNSLIGCWWGNRVMFLESQSSTFWFQLVWGLRACGQHTVNFFHLVGVLVSAQRLKVMAHEIIYSPWGGTQGPWLSFMAKQLLFCLAWLFSFVSEFLTSLIKFSLWNLGKAKEAKGFLQMRGGGHGRNLSPGRPHRVLYGFIIIVLNWSLYPRHNFCLYIKTFFAI